MTYKIKTSPVDTFGSKTPRSHRGEQSLPAPLSSIAVSCADNLQTLLRSMFAKVDDTFFELAEKARANTEQTMYFEALREIRVKRSGIENKFSQDIVNAFEQLNNNRRIDRKASNENQGGEFEPLSLDKLTVVQNDELELSLAFSTMISRAEDRLGNKLAQLNTRLNTLLGVNYIDDCNSPFSPSIACKIMSEASENLDIDIKGRLVFLKLFEVGVLHGLDTICDNANEALIMAGVLPDYDGYVRERNRHNRSAPVSSAGLDSQLARPDTPGISGEHIESLSILQQLLGQPQLNVDSVAQPPNPGLLSLLSGVRNVLNINKAPVSGAIQSGNSVDILPILKSLSDKPEQFNQAVRDTDREVIDLVAMLFDFILDDRNLAEPMKVLVSRLQIPMVRLGLLDRALFSKRSHPARKLLNEIASAALGWNDVKEPEKDPLYCKIQDITEIINDEFDEDTALFEGLLEEFIGFIDINNRKSQLIEKRTKEEEEGKEKVDEARSMVQKIINGYLIKRELPDVTIALLRDYWSKVLFLDYVKNGPDSESWNTAVEMVKKLIWSAEPKSDNKKCILMYQTLPGLYQELCEGLSSINSDPIGTTVILRQLDLLYFGKELDEPRDASVAAAAAAAITNIVNDVPNVKMDTARKISASQQENNGQLDSSGIPVLRSVVTADTLNYRVDEANKKQEFNEEDIDESVLTRADNIEVGAWVRFTEQNDQNVLCKLALKMKTKTKHIFVDRRGLKVAEKSRLGLAYSLQCGECEILEEDKIFDRALESVISNLRDREENLTSNPVGDPA